MVLYLTMNGIIFNQGNSKFESLLNFFFLISAAIMNILIFSIHVLNWDSESPNNFKINVIVIIVGKLNLGC